MTVFAVSFRIADQRSALGDYPERWRSLTETIQGMAIGRNYWKETSSFFVIQTNIDTSASLADAIVLQSYFDSSRDLLLIVNLDVKGFAIRGHNSDGDLDAIMSLRRRN